MRIIDSHVHVWKNDPDFPWPSENQDPPKEDRTPEMLLERMEAHGIEKTVLVQVRYYLWDNRYIAHVVKQYPDKFMAVGRINPEDPAAPEALTMWKEDYGVHGARLSPGVEAGGDWFAGPLMPPILARAEKLGVPLILLTRGSRLRDLAPLLEAHPNVDVVIDHMAWTKPTDGSARQLLLDLARFPRVYVKISHTWTVSEEAYPWKDTHSWVDELHQTFGPQRLMFGTDWPVCLRAMEYPQVLSVVRDEMKFFTAEDLEWVLRKTALRIWRFEAANFD